MTYKNEKEKCKHKLYLEKCECGHLKEEHLKYGSRTLGMSSAYRECVHEGCRCREYRKVK